MQGSPGPLKRKAPRSSVEARAPRKAPRPPSARALLGRRAELAVADYLAARGLEVLKANVRVGRFELDLVAREGPVAVVVEVRTRGASSYQRALDSVDPRKQARLRAAAERLWRDELSRDASLERLRFDVASVTFEGSGGVRIEHVRAAF